MSSRILIADAVSTECDRILESRGLEVVRAVGLPKEKLMEMLPEFEGMIIRSAVTADREMIEQMSMMRVIGRAGTGVDNIDIIASTEKGIIVMNVPDGNTISAAEHAIAVLFSMLRKVPAANASLRSGSWDRKSFTGTEILHKNIGILGLGRIGREVAIRLQSFGVRVLGYDPVLSPEAVSELGVEPVDFDTLVESSDILSVHIPLLPATRGIIGKAEMGRMKKGSFIVNCARGGIVDEAALLEALESGQIAGAGLDVYDKEPPTFPNPLIEHPNVVATPHIAASTNEAQERVALAIAHQIADYFEGKGAAGVVNASGLESSFKSEAMPLMHAAERLGALLGQLVGNTDVDCTLTVYGAEASQIVRGLGASFLAGMLGLGLDSTVNAVNAGLLAEQNRVTLVTAGEGHHPHFTTLIQAEASGPKGESRSAGVTVFGHNETRLVTIDGVSVDVRPEGTLLLFENVDRPGVLAAVGNVLAAHGVNIADVTLGRREGTGHAVTVMRVDDDLSDGLLGELSRLDVVQRVRTLTFEGASAPASPEE
jgi:D-3-phosphoglycerate dehydrogenase